VGLLQQVVYHHRISDIISWNATIASCIHECFHRHSFQPVNCNIIDRPPSWSLLTGHSFTMSDIVWTIPHVHFSEDARPHLCSFFQASPDRMPCLECSRGRSKSSPYFRRAVIPRISGPADYSGQLSSVENRQTRCRLGQTCGPEGTMYCMRVSVWCHLANTTEWSMGKQIKVCSLLLVVHCHVKCQPLQTVLIYCA